MVDGFEAQVAKVRESGVLGRSDALARLFDYLADKAATDQPVREADIAVDVFGREIDVAGDASVRVYVHRLRKKLDDFYGEELPRLTLPVGEYRLALMEAPPVEVAPRPWPWRRIVAGVVAVVLIAAGVWAWRVTTLDREISRAAATPLWDGFGAKRPVLVVVGDYYIFGDTEGADQPQRMIRNFDVNSPADLEALLMQRPELQGRYVDIDTYYTPVGATLALREMLPLARHLAGRDERVQIVMSSQLTPEMMKTADVIYVGYLSALRLLQQPVFEGSRFEVGETFDELVDKRSGQVHVSSAGSARPGRPNQDYGYLAAFEGPGGNRIVVVAGGRDIGVMQTAEIATDAKQLPMRVSDSFEQLYRVEGLGRTNLSSAPVD